MMNWVKLAIVMGLVWPALAKPSVKEFGKTDGGEPVKVVTLRNDGGMSVEVLTYGAIIKSLNVPDREGRSGNVVLSTDSIEQYEKFNASAAVIGRVANRIKGAQFALNGEVFHLMKNARGNSIHGGKPGFQRVVWKLEWTAKDNESESVALSYLSPHGEAGFPGNLKVRVTYTLTKENELVIDYSASTDRPTVVNLTNHAYFNFSGEGKVLDHELWLSAKSYTPTDRDGIPTGKIESVAGTPLDFTRSMKLGKMMEALQPAMKGYDHNFVLPEGNGMMLAGRLVDPKSGRVMEVLTSQPGLQLYTGNHLDHRAVCLETQHFPDSPNQAHFPTTTVTPDKGYRESVMFRFTVK